MELIRNAPVERLAFEDGNWVDLKSRLTVTERKRLTQAGLVAGGEMAEANKPRFSFDLVQSELAALEIGIVGWSLPEAVTAENIGLLDDETADTIKKRLDELWRGRSDDERKNSSGVGAPRSGARESLASSAGSR